MGKTYPHLTAKLSSIMYICILLKVLHLTKGKQKFMQEFLETLLHLLVNYPFSVDMMEMFPFSQKRNLFSTM